MFLNTIIIRLRGLTFMKKGVIFLIIVLSVFVLAGCKKNIDTAKSINPNSALNPDCANAKNQAAKDTCYSNIGIQKKDLSACSKIKNPQTKDSCYGTIAILKSDAAICSSIQNTELKDRCYSEIAINKKDFGICNKIISKELKNYCQNKVSTSLISTTLLPVSSFSSNGTNVEIYQGAISEMSSSSITLKKGNRMRIFPISQKYQPRFLQSGDTSGKLVTPKIGDNVVKLFFTASKSQENYVSSVVINNTQTI